MDKTTKETAPTAEMVESLQKQLEKERRKNQNLATQCARLGEALDTAIRAKDARIEGDMICIVNTNAANRKAMKKKAAEVYARAMKMDKSYMRACTMNAITLVISIPTAAATIIAGHLGIISPDLATALSFILLPIAGWATHDCSLLYKFTDSSNG